MKVLLDTNILLRLLNINHADHGRVRQAIEKLKLAGIDLVIVPQVLYEYWVVATRPISANGFGLSPADADANLDRASAVFTLLLDERGIYPNWKSLILNYSVSGKNGHDARLVAAMIRHGVPSILSFNSSDFARYPMIDTKTPDSVIGN